MERLIGAILLKAVEDWRDPQKQTEVEEFLNSDWFEDLVAELNLDATTLRNQLKTGTYKQLSTRAAYR